MLRKLVPLVFVLWISAALKAQSGVIRPGEQWLDDRGQPIQAHGGGIIQWHGTYYWFGEDRSRSNDPAKRYVACYSSKDLTHWRFRNQAVAMSDPEKLGLGWVLERPKVFANSRTGKFVMYAHLDDASYKLARVAVLVSNTIDGQYKYVRSFRPLNQESRDIGQFVDDDGAAYLIFESRPTHGFFIARLSEDFMSVKEQTSFIRAPLEGGAVVHVRGRYFAVGSHLTGWAPNPNVYAVARSIRGPWSSFRNLAPPSSNTYGSQSSMLLKIKGARSTSVVFMGDLWRPQKIWDSRYLWLPLEIRGDALRLPTPRPWTIDVKAGTFRWMKISEDPGHRNTHK